MLSAKVGSIWSSCFRQRSRLKYEKLTDGRRTDDGRTPVSSTNKTNRHEITEILLKVALNIKIPNPIPNQVYGAKPNNKLFQTRIQSKNSCCLLGIYPLLLVTQG
jgi:hypothetical protein